MNMRSTNWKLVITPTPTQHDCRPSVGITTVRIPLWQYFFRQHTAPQSLAGLHQSVFRGFVQLLMSRLSICVKVMVFVYSAVWRPKGQRLNGYCKTQQRESSSVSISPCPAVRLWWNSGSAVGMEDWECGLIPLWPIHALSVTRSHGECATWSAIPDQSALSGSGL